MYIIPFIRVGQQPQPQEKKQFPFRMIWVFLTEGGNEVWKTEETTPSVEEVVREYLVENGFHGTPYYSESMDTLFYEVDPVKTQMKQFYMWNDFLSTGAAIPREVDVWRPFFFLGESIETPVKGGETLWGWKDVCEKMTLGPFGNAANLWKGVFAAVADAEGRS